MRVVLLRHLMGQVQHVTSRPGREALCAAWVTHVLFKISELRCGCHMIQGLLEVLYQVVGIFNAD